MVVTLDIEQELWDQGIDAVAGVDEAGRGPLAGPVVAAAVVFPRGLFLPGVDDSKKLSARRREDLFEVIRTSALAWGVGVVSHEVVDRMNILGATMEAMHVAVAELHPAPGILLVDGNRFRRGPIPHRTVVRGDAISFTIAAASIIAKVTRDRLMIAYDAEYPEYGFVRHKGYGTPEHLAAIRKHGLSPIHRRSFHLSEDRHRS